jgi:hypothetical protein
LPDETSLRPPAGNRYKFNTKIKSNNNDNNGNNACLPCGQAGGRYKAKT